MGKRAVFRRKKDPTSSYQPILNWHGLSFIPALDWNLRFHTLLRVNVRVTLAFFTLAGCHTRVTTCTTRPSPSTRSDAWRPT